MDKSRFILGLLIILLASACAGDGTDTPVPTPVPTIVGSPLETDSVSPITLLRNPFSFEGHYLTLAGKYRKLPIQVCPGESYRSPVSWSLAVEGLEIPAAGFEKPLQELAAEGLEMVVEGRWQEWEGPVGCGRRNPVQQVWYLAVTEIVSPNPLTLVHEVDLIADSGDQEMELTAAPPLVTVVSLPTPTFVQFVATGTTTPIPADSELTNTEESPLDFDDDTSELTITPADQLSETAFPDLTPTISSSPVFTLTPTASTTGTPAATTTQQADATATGIAGQATNTPDANQTPGPGEGFLNYEDIISGQISPGEVKRWSFVGSAGDVTSISAASAFNLDIALELVSPGGTILVTSDDGGPGEPETISQTNLNTFGTYRIRIKSMNDSSGGFALVLSDSESEAFYEYRATLDDGSSGTEDLPEGVDYLYAFGGTAGNRITAAVESISPSNMVLYLYDPSGVELEFIDDIETASSGVTEELSNYLLPISGFYTLRIGEWDFDPATYRYSLEIE